MHFIDLRFFPLRVATVTVADGVTNDATDDCDDDDDRVRHDAS